MTLHSGRATDAREKLLTVDLESPRWLLSGFDLIGQSALFVKVSRRKYRESTFLDFRCFPERANWFKCGLRALGDAFSEMDVPPVCYIFHTGYSCSTLLSRCLDFDKETLVLREPFALHQLCLMRSSTEHDICDVHVDWEKLLSVAIQVMSRRYVCTQSVILKMDANVLLHRLVSIREGSKAIFVYAPLEDFMASVLSSQQRREWLWHQMNILRGFRAWAPEVAGISQSLLHKACRSDGECAALFWALQIGLYQAASQCSKSVIPLISARDIVESTHATVKEVAKHFAVCVSRKALARNLANWVGAHAKDSGPFGAQARKAQMELMRRKNAVEIRRGLNFFRDIADFDSLAYRLTVDG